VDKRYRNLQTYRMIRRSGFSRELLAVCKLVRG
jgi:hypothetical protein